MDSRNKKLFGLILIFLGGIIWCPIFAKNDFYFWCHDKKSGEDSNNKCGGIVEYYDRGEKRLKTASSWMCLEKSMCESGVKSSDDTTYEYGRCVCDAQCLTPISAVEYYDKVDVNTGGPNGAAIETNNTPEKQNPVYLPVLLSWKGVEKPEKNTIWILREEGGGYSNSKKYGAGAQYDPTIATVPRSYRVEFRMGEGLNTENYAPSAKIKGKVIGKNTKYGEEVFSVVVPARSTSSSNLEWLNSVDDIGQCFFNSNSTIEWRVLACCDENGESCEDPGKAIWWKFKTSGAPEPMGVRNGSGKLVVDPDWVGAGWANIPVNNSEEFCKIKLEWCQARLSDNPLAYNYYNKNLPQGGWNGDLPKNSFSYQLRAKSTENNGLLTAIGGSSTAKDLLSMTMDYLRSQADNLLKGVPLIYQNYTQDFKSALASDDCHYLEAQYSNDSNRTYLGCKPEVISLSTSQILDKKFIPNFSKDNNSTRDRTLFTGGLTYTWQVKTCFSKDTSDDADICDSYEPIKSANFDNVESRFSQAWKFTSTLSSGLDLEAPNLQSPANNKESALPTTANLIGVTGYALSWTVPCGANSFIYDIQKENGDSIFKSDLNYSADQGRRIKNSSQVFLKPSAEKNPKQPDDSQNAILALDTAYRWRVRSCWPSNPLGNTPMICSKNWSDAKYGWFKFRTTGRTPTGLKEIDDAPTVTFTWDHVPAAESYRFYLNDGSGGLMKEQGYRTNQVTYTCKYANQPLSWFVRSCAGGDAVVCGEAAGARIHNCPDFAMPTDLTPSGDILSLPSQLSWKSKAKFFKVTATYSGQKDSSCDPDWFNATYKDVTFLGTSMPIQTALTGASPFCPGNYSFSVQACFDAACTFLSNDKNIAKKTFTVTGGAVGKDTGFMVCGQDNPGPNRLYNAKEPCQIKHIFLILKIIIDWVMFKLAVVLLPIMMLISGLMFYLAEDKSKVFGTIKDGWRNVGIGYLILIFAWLLVSWMMLIAGYNGIWWRIL